MTTPLPAIPASEAPALLLEGLKLALSKPCRPYVLLPLLVNVLLLGWCGYLIYSYLNSFIISLTDYLPAFLGLLIWLLSFIVGASIIMVACYMFSTVATIIASPFYGLLADRAEKCLTGHGAADLSLTELLGEVPRIIKRECVKLLYFLPRVLCCLIITLIPGVNAIAPFMWFLLAAWMATLQYTDYSYDNHRISFRDMKTDLGLNTWGTLVFGGLIAFALTVPILNLLIPPAAVCAGTRFYLKARGLTFSTQEAGAAAAAAETDAAVQPGATTAPATPSREVTP